MSVALDSERMPKGVARALLAALEAKARQLGYEVARLDTGPRQPRARAYGIPISELSPTMNR